MIVQTYSPQEMALMQKLIQGIFRVHLAISGQEFYTYQTVFAKRIIESVLMNDGATITGLWSRQSGKTTVVAELIITLAIILPVLANELNPYKVDPKTGETLPERDIRVQMLMPFIDGLRIGIFAPIEHQAQLSFVKMRTIAHSERCKEFCEDDQIGVNIQTSRGDTLSFTNGSVIWARTASPNSKVEGETFHIILIDEAQDVDRFKAEKEIEPMRAATNGTLVKIGTANVSRGGFHVDIEFNIEKHKLGLAPRNHFQFDYKRVIEARREAAQRTGDKSHLRYEKYVEKRKAFLGGEKSKAFRMNFMLMWQESNANAISARAILTCKDNTRELNVETAIDYDAISRWIRVGGLDIGKSNDNSVATALEYDEANPVMFRDSTSGDIVRFYPKRVVGLLSLQGNFEDTIGVASGQYTEIVKFFRKWKTVAIMVDATSMGDPVVERLRVLAPEIDWNGFKFNMITKMNLYRHYVDEWEAGRVKLASKGESDDDPKSHDWHMFIEEHKNLERTIRGNYVDYHAPKPKAKTQNTDEDEYHDDFPDSCALAVWMVKMHVLQEVHVDRHSARTHTNQSGIQPRNAVSVLSRGSNRSRYRTRWGK